MKRLEVSGAVRPIYGSLGVIRLRMHEPVPLRLQFLLMARSVIKHRDNFFLCHFYWRFCLYGMWFISHFFASGIWFIFLQNKYSFCPIDKATFIRSYPYPNCVLPSPFWSTHIFLNDWLWAGRSGDRIPVGARFSATVQTGPGAHPASCTMATGSFPGVKSGRGLTLTRHPF